MCELDAIKKYWHRILIICIFFVEALVLFICRENIYVGICDNLDLFISQLKVLKDSGTFFSHGQTVGILGGISRDYLPTEFSLYNILYFFLPDIYAYIIGYLLKLVISFVSCILLAKLLLGEKYKRYEKPLYLAAAAFALLPVYPMYGLCFASMPIILYLLIRIYREPKPWLYLMVFLYPLVSYFSFFGAFILGYILIAFVILWIKDKKPSLPLLGAFAALAAGYVCFEYRLFGVMLFSDEETIRSTMVIQSYGAGELWSTFADVFLHGFSHARSAHTYFVLPVCAVYFVYINIGYIRGKRQGKPYTDAFNITILFIIFNCLVYALYYWEPLRSLVETLVPPLKGFQYGRTIFFNTFAWYFAFFIVLKDVFDRSRLLSCAMGILSILIVAGTQCEYSDFYNTVYCNLYKLVKNAEPNQLSYGEFFAEQLVEDIKSDIAYTSDKGACAYGLHPAMLSYNGITTVDGYCGYYSQSYKESFREAIAPTLDKNANWEAYYDEWGCRAYLFSASGSNTYDFGADALSQPQEILIDSAALKELGCDYIFSRFELTNAEEAQLSFVGKYSHDDVPYDIYLYELN